MARMIPSPPAGPGFDLSVQSFRAIDRGAYSEGMDRWLQAEEEWQCALEQYGWAVVADRIQAWQYECRR
jgi:hypothetical protein